MTTLQIGEFAAAGEYLLLADGAPIAASKSYNSIQGIARALAGHFAHRFGCDEPPILCACRPEFPSDEPIVILPSVDGDLFMEGIPPWPAYRERECAREWRMPGSREVLIECCVGREQLTISFAWVGELDPRQRAHALRQLDEGARKLWDQRKVKK